MSLGDIVFTGSSETPDECGISSVVTKQPEYPVYLNSFCFFLRLFDSSMVIPGYAKYVFRSSETRKKIVKTANGVTRFNVSKKKMEDVTIPVPPLPIQNEIADILDNFTKLTAELTAELTARRAQYEYYRDKLLTFDDETAIVKRIKDMLDQTCGGPEKVEYKRLGDIAVDIYRGSGIRRDQIVEDGIPCVRYGEIYTDYGVYFETCKSHTSIDAVSSPKWFSYGDVLFAITGESVEEIAKSTVYLGQEKCLAGGDIVVLRHLENPKYMAYVLSTVDAQRQKSKGKIKSKVVHTSIPLIAEIVIPVPPLSVQEEIVSILDKFNTLTTDISTGLPAEISLRQKQYEHYRDRLLNFNGLTPRK